MKERLQKIISARGIASRRAAENMIREGRVTLNGRKAILGDTGDPSEDKILIDGTPLPSEPEKVYIMLNKPRGYVTTLSDDRGRKTVAQLVKLPGIRVYPVGRLDIDSEGLLLMTNDGELAHMLMHPSFEIQKTYSVKVKGDIGSGLDILNTPIDIDGKKVTAKSVRQTDDQELMITIGEGRNRQVRRMCEAAGLEVKRLKRVSEGGVRLGNLASGDWRYLTKQEIKLLFRRAGSEK